MSGNFYSEPLKDEVKRLRAELSNERALCALLAEALQSAVDDAAGKRNVWFFKARAALSELEKSK